MKKKVANKKTPELLEQMDQFREKHASWKSHNQIQKKGFFPVFNDFKHTYLAKISGGALKAYIYLGLHANNKTGECWHSNETISEFFGVDLRTVKKWMAELESLELISRVQVGFNRAANTFLIPYKTLDVDEDLHINPNPDPLEDL